MLNYYKTDFEILLIFYILLVLAIYCLKGCVKVKGWVKYCFVNMTLFCRSLTKLPVGFYRF